MTRRAAATRWAIAGIILLLAGGALGIVAAGDGTIPGDLAAMLAIQQPVSEPLDRVAWIVSRAADTFPPMTALALLVVAALAWRGRGDLALLVALAFAVRAIGPALKWAIDSPRPTVDVVAVVYEPGGLGYPSGHALGAALLYGTIAAIAPQVLRDRLSIRIVQAGAAAMILLTAWSRVRLGVHWPSDVLGGVLFGTGVICLLHAVWLAWRAGKIKT